MLRRTPPPAQRWREEESRGRFPPPPVRKGNAGPMSEALALSSTNHADQDDEYVLVRIHRSIWEQLKETKMDTATNTGTQAPEAPQAGVTPAGENHDPAPQPGSLRDLWDGMSPGERTGVIVAGSLATVALLYAVFK